MIREKIKVEDFDRISLENDYYLWHFVLRDVSCKPSMHSIFDNLDDEMRNPNSMVEFLNTFNVPYFESYVEESVDFLDKLGVPLERLRQKGELKTIKPFMLTFNRRRLVNATYNGYCFCPEGITDLLYNLNPEIIYNANLD
jgi:hypothetical protein